MNLAQLPPDTLPIPRYNKHVYRLILGQAVRLVEPHRIHIGHKFSSECHPLCALPKNLYSAANYRERQDFFAGNRALKESADCKALPAQVAQRALKFVFKARLSCRAAVKACERNPSAFSGIPEMAGDRGTIQNPSAGSYAAPCKNLAFPKRALQKHIAHPSGTDLYLGTEISQIAPVAIVPDAGFYVLEIAGAKTPQPQQPEAGNCAAAGPDFNSLATSAGSNPGLRPKTSDGLPHKEASRHASQRNAGGRSNQPHGAKTAKRPFRLREKRNINREWPVAKTNLRPLKQRVKNSASKSAIGCGAGGEGETLKRIEVLRVWLALHFPVWRETDRNSCGCGQSTRAKARELRRMWESRGGDLGVGRVSSLMGIEMPPIIYGVSKRASRRWAFQKWVSLLFR